MAPAKDTTNSAQKYLLITSDDFGYSEPRDDGIIECYKAGAITGSVAMVNGVSIQSGVKKAKAAGLVLGKTAFCFVLRLLECNGFTYLKPSRGFKRKPKPKSLYNTITSKSSRILNKLKLLVIYLGQYTDTPSHDGYSMLSS